MRISSGAFFLLLALAACGAVHTGGSGQLSNGRPVAGTISRDMKTDIITFSIMSPDGWSCTASKKKDANPPPAFSLPLKCTDGSTGTLLVSVNQFSDTATASFTLSNGKTGSVAFGAT